MGEGGKSFQRREPANEWWWDPWQKLGVPFPFSIGREQSLDNEDVADEVSKVRRKREEDKLAHPGQGTLGVNQACFAKMGPNRKLFLMSLVHPFHGSTALLGVLMSSHHLATLCSFNDWACEGRKILEISEEARLATVSADDVGNMSIIRADHFDTEALDMDQMLESLLEKYSKYWNLTRSIFFDKSPHLMLHVEAVHKALESYPLPHRMVDAGITRLDTAYVMMWRPFCLRQLSRHERETPMDLAAREELAILERSVDLHKWLVRRELPVLVINLAKLIWQPLNEKERILNYLPCLNHLDMNYLPELGVDIFPGNQWKADGSVKSFGEHVDPETVGYKLRNYSCAGSFRYENTLQGSELARFVDAEVYMSVFS